MFHGLNDITDEEVLGEFYRGLERTNGEITAMNYINRTIIAIILSIFVTQTADAVTRFVSINNATSIPPYTSWATAATNIQHAIDVAVPGDVVLVSNGVYQTGGRNLGNPNTMTNRVIITNAISVISMNGPNVTVIRGAFDPVSTNGSKAIRCVYLGSGSVLSGFTLTNGATSAAGIDSNYDGGGVFCQTNAVVSNCVINGNSAADEGGGVYGGSLYDCVVSGNSATNGGGTRGSSLLKCTVSNNKAISFGGGLYGGHAVQCVIEGNTSTTAGGGIFFGTATLCTINGNASGNGGGATQSTLNNCLLTGNSATMDGGGAEFCGLNNCTVVSNSAANGGGTFLGTNRNSIVYFNTAGTNNNADLSSFTYSCSTPLPAGSGNISNQPQFVSLSGQNFRLKSGSPGIDAGFHILITATNDLDGKPRIMNGSVDMGAYEFSPPVFVALTSTNPVAPFNSWATAATNIQNAIDAAFAGSIVYVSNGVYQTGGRVISESLTNRIAITKPITVQSVNGPQFTSIRGAYHPGGTNGDAAVRCVWMTNGSSLVGFTLTNGATRAAGVEQDGGGIWSQSAGTYISNCVVTRCASDFRGGGVFQGSLYSCTITGNLSTATGTGSGGGGVYGVWADRCHIVNNRALGGTISSGGGGAHNSILNNCLIARNQTTGGSNDNGGGGARDSTLYNCTVVYNSTDNDDDFGGGGGGALDSTIYNSIVYFNTAPAPFFGNGSSNHNSCSFAFSCSSPSAAGITVTANPLLVDAANGNYRLQTNSPCRDAGDNTYVQGTNDLDGILRIGYVTVDIGAYEWVGAPTVQTLPANSINADNAVMRGRLYVGPVRNYIFFEYGTTTNYGSFKSGTSISEGSGNNYVGIGGYVTGLVSSTLYHYRAGASNSVGITYSSNMTFTTLGAPLVETLSASNITFSGATLHGMVNPNATGGTCHVRFEYGLTTNVSDTSSVEVLAATNIPLSVQNVITGLAPGSVYYFRVVASNQSGIAYGVIASFNTLPLTNYVALTSTNPVPPFSSWATAATNIQDAIDVAFTGATVLVSNGVYQTGGRVLPGMNLTNRVIVDKPLLLRSMNGYQNTIIKGNYPDLTNLEAAVRGVYLVAGSTMDGFTITNGSTMRTSGILYDDHRGGGVMCEPGTAITNCYITGNRGRAGGGVAFGAVYNSIINDNLGEGLDSADGGGGAYGSTLWNCRLEYNSTRSTRAGSMGGGALYSTLNSCALNANSATINFGQGGGAGYSILNNCAIIQNEANIGSGVYGSKLVNSTVYLNGHITGTDGIHSSTSLNSIVYANGLLSARNYSNSIFSYSCTRPLPPGDGNITNDPLFALTYTSNWNVRLLPWSPGINAGDNALAVGSVDLYGNARIADGTVDMGAAEFAPAPPTAITMGAFSITTTSAILQGAIDPGDSNTIGRFEYGITTNYGSTSPDVDAYSNGDWQINLPVSNLIPGVTYHFRFIATNSQGSSYGDNMTFNTTTLTNYVAITSINPVPPYSSWATAATNIQDAIDVAVTNATVLVSNGVYATGGRAVFGILTNRISITKPIRVIGMNGPAVTVIQGSGPMGDSAVRCAYVTNGASLEGFTLTNGATRMSGNTQERSGGGAWCEPFAMVSNCMVIGNAASFRGGGIYGGQLTSCTLANNQAINEGGGASQGILNNCALTGNSASYGGGAQGSILTNCTVANNHANVEGGGAHMCTMTNCLITGNSSPKGGGTYGSRLYHCRLFANQAIIGGGAAGSFPDVISELFNCLLMGNRSSEKGGGADSSTLSSCTVYGNETFAGDGGGIYGCAVFNTIVYFNQASGTGPNHKFSYLGNSCSTPLSNDGTNMITADPQFVDAVNSNFQLQAWSPCINSGDNAFNILAIDMAGNPRVAGGVIDIGAYEFQGSPVPPPYAPSAVPGSPFVAIDPAQQNDIGDNVDLATNGNPAVASPQGGFGSFGNIFINYDATNLYLGGYGVDIAGNNNYMALFLGLNTLSDDASGLNGRNGLPNGLDNLNNLRFAQPMDVALLLGDEWGDGNYPNFNIGSGSNIGQGVYYIQNSSFLSMPNARLSQFDGTEQIATISTDDDGNQSMDRWEVQLSWSDLNAAGIGSVTQLFLCGVFASDGTGSSGAYISANYLGANVADGKIDAFGNYAFSTVSVHAISIALPNVTDSDNDGIPDYWEIMNGLDPNSSNSPTANADGDWMTDFEEYIADTHPTNGMSFFPKVALTNPPPGVMIIVVDPTSTARVYHVELNTNLFANPQIWEQSGSVQTGSGSAISFPVTNDLLKKIYRTGVRFP